MPKKTPKTEAPKTLLEMVEDAANKPLPYEGLGSISPNARLAPPTKGDNPQHREDFNWLLNAASRGSRPNHKTA